MAETFFEQASVEWRYGEKSGRGRVMEKLTVPTDLDGSRIEASPDDPYYVVQDYETGKLTAHKPDALTRI